MRYLRCIFWSGFLLASALQGQPSQLNIEGFKLTAAGAIDCKNLAKFAVDDKSLFNKRNESRLQQVGNQVLAYVQSLCPGATRVALLSKNQKSQRLIRGQASVSTAQPVPRPPLKASLLPGAPAAPKSNLRSLVSVGGKNEKCEVILAWLRRIDEEIGSDGRHVAYHAPPSLNIFRDREFRPVFGVSYTSTTPSWRGKLWTDRISWCLGVQPLQQSRFPKPLDRYRSPKTSKFSAEFQPYRTLLQGAFGQPSRGLSFAKITSELKEMAAAQSWMNATLADAASESISADQALALARAAKEAGRKIAKLWPSERLEFEKMLGDRRRVVAAALVGQWTVELNDFPESIDGAKALSAAIRSREAVFEGLGNSSPRRVWIDRAIGRLGELTAAPAQDLVKKLDALPRTLAGVRQGMSLYREFSLSLQHVPANSTTQDLEQAYRAWRSAALDEAYGEWVAQLKGNLDTLDKLVQAEKRLDSLFPGPSKAEAEYAQYREPIADARAAAEAAQRAARRQVNAASGTLDAAGLSNAAIFQALHLGDFVEIPFDRSNVRFRLIFGQYLESYARQCAASLPADKVEMTEEVCIREQQWVNGYGQVTSTQCIETRTVGTGLFADPKLYAAYRHLAELGGVGEGIRQAIGMWTQGMAGMQNMVADLSAIRNEVPSLVRQNDCDGRALEHLEANLLLFALGKPSLQDLATKPALPSGPFRDSDYQNLLEDLVAKQSRSWALNRFVIDSLSDVSVVARDAQGRPQKITGWYMFDGLSGRRRGSVTLTFNGATPECLYFFDAPTTCRTADRGVAAAYAQGSYLD